ncbi:cupin domain-containing protein [Hippea alviniae]|uniref:cupin domain-containing protein n=1 Tax=Hippea alviniae TaxID=1279027 RepID=UPI0003B4A695|nr:cupin domain-containing protein [Hippea alviniae]
MKKFLVLIAAIFLSVPAFGKSKQPEFLVKNALKCPQKVYGGGFLVREVIHPKNDGVNPGFSTSYITLKPHSKTEPHKLTKSAQVYYILKGEAILHIGNKTVKAKPNMAIYIAPNVIQWAENKSNRDFVFLCIVSPPWYKSEEKVLK